ncbi:47 kDa outer membrane protein precursor [Plesiomonas shigelloides]|uniref:outer membrane protein transport protein n=1 Tax=Plesiomonas shigelloides TaxID=703 RepID=UPI000E0891A3|nr:outer membrane protein transport protein [Plesiomonas shigelloides]SUB63000.1 47 kDa outer membrane protein precursor [Plesiomonas shigelloides]
MNKKNIARLITGALSGGLLMQAHAAGFQLAEYSATGLGRAFAGEAAIADNASAQARNPALLAQFDSLNVSAGAIYVNPNIDLKGTTTTPLHTKIATQARDVAGDAWIPNAYAAMPINEHWFAGLAINSNFGMSTDLESSFAGTQFGNHTKVRTVEFNPNIAYKLSDEWQLGAGVRYVQGEGSIGASAPYYLSALPQTKPFAGKTLKYMEGDDHAWGWQAGAVWQPTKDTRIGAAYHSQIKLDLSGHAEGLVYDMAMQQRNGQYPGVLPLTLPASAELAAFHQITPQWAVHGSLNWTEWSKFKELVADIQGLGNDTVKVENWRNSYRLALGTTYTLDDSTRLRGGVAYDRSAVDSANRTLSIPEMDRYWFSAGIGHDFTPNLTVDAALTYIAGKKADVSEPRPHIANDAQAGMMGTFTGQASGDIWLTGVQVTYRF